MSYETHSFYLNAAVWAGICVTHGWTAGQISKMAAALGCTRAHMSQVLAHKNGMSAEMMARVIEMCKIEPGGRWDHLFEIGKSVSKNSQKENYLKFNGVVPYNKYSAAATSRGIDDIPEEK